jgi:hypothetical protein
MPRYHVYYARRPTFHPSGEHGTPPLTGTALCLSHAWLFEIEAVSLDDAFRRMQGENWSPQGEARELLQALGLNHTSMSVGDVLRDQEGTCWECLDQGWRPLAADAGGGADHVQV